MCRPASIGPSDGPGFWWAMRAVSSAHETTPACMKPPPSLELSPS